MPPSKHIRRAAESSAGAASLPRPHCERGRIKAIMTAEEAGRRGLLAALHISYDRPDDYGRIKTPSARLPIVGTSISGAGSLFFSCAPARVSAESMLVTLWELVRRFNVSVFFFQ